MVNTAAVHRAAASIANAGSAPDKVAATADWYLQRMTRLVAAGLVATKERVDLIALTMLCASSRTSVLEYMERDDVSVEANLRAAALKPARSVAELLLRVAGSSANATRCDYPGLLVSSTQRSAKTPSSTVGQCMMAFDRTNPEAISWAQKHAAKLVTEVSEESRSAIRSVIARAFKEGFAPREAAVLIREAVSLTEAQANAVVNLHLKILSSPGKLLTVGGRLIRVPVEGMTEARTLKVLEQYSSRLLRQRALNIARTETIAAANKGQILLWEQAKKNGQLPKTIRHEWIAALSERTCPQCSSLSGETVKVGENFSFGGAYPPAHPSCRCTTGLVN